MRKLIQLLGRINVVTHRFSKKAYTRGMVIICGGMMTVLLLGTNGYAVHNKAVNTGTIDEQSEDPPLEVLDEVAIAQSIIEPPLEDASNPLPMMEEDLQKQLIGAQEPNQVLKETILYTEMDYIALVNIVEAEATGEDIIGKILVANVVLNRVKSERFPDSIYDVVYQKINGKAQFSPIDDGRMGSLPISESTYEAVERALKGEDYSKGALFFVARSIASENAVSWFDENLKKVTEHGVHEFFTYK